MNIFGRHKNTQEEAIVQKSTEYLRKLVIACLAEKENHGIGFALEEWKEFFDKVDPYYSVNFYKDLNYFAIYPGEVKY